MKGISCIQEGTTPRFSPQKGFAHDSELVGNGDELHREVGTGKGYAGHHRIVDRSPVPTPQIDFNHDNEQDVIADSEYTVYPTHVAYRIYQKGMLSARCKRIGDGSFFISKRSWDRLTKDFPTSKAGKKRLFSLAFDGDARFVYEEVAGFNPDASSEELWDMLGNRLCNDIHQSTLRDRFFPMTWNEKRETFEKFAWCLCSAALLLPGAVDDGLLLNRLKNGLPNRLQDQAKLVSGTFDEVVSRVSSLSTAQGNRHEAVREVREGEKAQAETGRAETLRL